MKTNSEECTACLHIDVCRYRAGIFSSFSEVAVGLIGGCSRFRGQEELEKLIAKFCKYSKASIV